MKKIILYHGTDIETAKKISKSGLKPTHDSKQSNWTENPSRTDSVYLTDTFAVKFGLIASECNDRLNDFAIITVEVNEDDLYPDEDFLAQIPKCLYESLGLDIEVADYDLIILETSGIGQSDTEIVDHSDISLYLSLIHI